MPISKYADMYKQIYDKDNNLVADAPSFTTAERLALPSTTYSYVVFDTDLQQGFLYDHIANGWTALTHSNIDYLDEINQSLSTTSIPTFSAVQFHLTATPTEHSEGHLHWSDNDKTLEIDTEVNGVSLQIGQEQYIRVTNKTGDTLTNGTVVRVNGSQGFRPTITKAQADTEANSSDTIAILTHDIANNGTGYATTIGLVRGLNTSAFLTEGCTLYLSPDTAGGIIDSTPVSPNHTVKVGYLLKSHVSEGIILVHIQDGGCLKSLHDVLITSQTDKQIIYWDNSSSVWRNDTISNIIGQDLSASATPNFVALDVGDYDGGNYVHLDGDKGIELKGEALVWQDIDFPIIIRQTGAGIPTLSTLQGNITAPQWQVNDVNICEGQEFVHIWNEGSRVYWHLHMITNGTDVTNRYVKWEVEWFWCNVNEQLTSTQTQSVEYEIPADTPDRTMVIVSVYNWIPTGGRIGGHCFARLKRVAASGTAPSGDPFCTMLQLHIQCDTLGSRNIATK